MSKKIHNEEEITGKYPAIVHTKSERNSRLYQYLLSVGLVATPIFKKDTSDIEYIQVSSSRYGE
jgi:hypothetical protein